MPNGIATYYQCLLILMDSSAQLDNKGRPWHPFSLTKFIFGELHGTKNAVVACLKSGQSHRGNIELINSRTELLVRN